MSIISYAQNFEDVMLWRALGHVQNGFYIDVGAQHPLVDSVSKVFYEHGWRGIHIEPTPDYAALLRQDRPDETVLQAALAQTHGTLSFYEIPETGLSTADPAIAQRHREQGFAVSEITVPCITLADVFERAGSRDIHWLKIDVEGYEQQVLSGWAGSVARPWLVIVESTLPLTQIETHESWETILVAYGYSPVYFDGLNRYYASDAKPEIKNAFRAPPNVFDSFTLNGTASAPFHKLVEERFQSQANAIRTELENRIQLAQKEIERLTESHKTQKDELGEREQVITQELRAAQEELRRLERERAEHIASQAEHEIRQNSEFTRQILEIRQESAARERELTQEITQGQQELRTLLRAQAQREKALCEEIAGFQREIQALQHAQRLQAQQHGFEIGSLREEHKYLIQSGAALEAQLKAQVQAEQEAVLQLRQALAEVQQALATTQAALTWRMIAPLRAMAALITPKKKRIPMFSVTEHAAQPQVVELIHSESQPDNVQPASVESLMLPSAQVNNPNTPAIASTLDELLAYHDQQFVHCAYQMLLGRDPDPEGMKYYLGRVRAGIPKIQILAQLRLSAEGKIHAATLSGLDGAIRRYRWARNPIFGWLLRLFADVESNKATERKLRAIENQLYVLSDESTSRFSQIEMALAGLHNLVLQQTQSVIAASDSTTQTTLGVAGNPPIQQAEPEGLKQLSPRARDIYFQLKAAAAIHAQRVA